MCTKIVLMKRKTFTPPNVKWNLYIEKLFCNSLCNDNSVIICERTSIEFTNFVSRLKNGTGTLYSKDQTDHLTCEVLIKSNTLVFNVRAIPKTIGGGGHRLEPFSNSTHYPQIEIDLTFLSNEIEIRHYSLPCHNSIPIALLANRISTSLSPYPPKLKYFGNPSP